MKPKGRIVWVGPSGEIYINKPPVKLATVKPYRLVEIRRRKR